MNISFHYFTVKTLCHYAGFPEERAQDIAFYSQLVDDFNLSKICNADSMMQIKGSVPDFFLKEHLALEDKVNGTYLFYPATPGIRLAQSAYSMFNKLHQIYTVIPFHFIPPTEYSPSERPEYRCEQAEPGDGSLIDRLLGQFFEDGVEDDMRLGLLLHVYADTYAHQNFSGRWGKENYCRSESISIADDPEETMFVPESTWYYYPAIGHAELNHVPDAFGLKFTARFDKPLSGGRQSYARNNAETFLLCAERIFEMLKRYHPQEPANGINFGTKLAPRLRAAGNACLDGPDEVSDVPKLAEIWKKEFRDVAYSYSYTPMWGLTPAGKGRDGKSIYEADDKFFAFNRCAYEHLHDVLGEYRVCLFD